MSKEVPGDVPGRRVVETRTVPFLPYDLDGPLQPEMSWLPISYDRASGNGCYLMRMAPGARLPDHEHVEIEQTYVLEGSLVCPEGECKAGEFVWRPAGSRHEAWGGPQGGLMLAIFQLPNRFYSRDGRETDFLGNDWQKAWGGRR